MKSQIFNVPTERFNMFDEDLDCRRRIMKRQKIYRELRVVDFLKNEFLKSSMKNDNGDSVEFRHRSSSTL